MAVTSAKEFLDLLEKSGLLDHGRLAQARSDVREGENATTLAKRLVETGLLTDWQGAQLVAGRSSFTLGKYKLIRLLGRGGMGGVFLAEHMTMHRRVALKTISRDFGSTPGSLEQFLLEARTIATLDHPNIVQAYNFDQEGGRFFLVMEYIDGQDLEQIVEEQGPLEGNVAADYIRQAADGLQHGHERKIIHCDIKPSNLLLNDKGVVKIVDMGMSRLQDPDKAGEGTGGDQILGSVDYLAPEQALESKDFDHRADIYSLGCTLYFLLTGRPPFPEGSLHEKLMKHQTVEPAPVTESRSDLSEKLVEVCEKMMAKEPAGRYQSAAEVGKALAKLPPPKRRAKPAAPLKTAPSEPEREHAPLIDVGDSDTSVMARLTPRAGAAARKEKSRKGSGKGVAAAAPGFLATPQQKIIAGSAAGAALLLLLAILMPFLLSSGAKPPDDWLEPDGQVVTPGKVPSAPPEEPVPSPVDAAEPGKRTLVFDFETGDLQGWKVVKGKFDYLVSDRAKTHDNPNQAYNKQGKYHLTTGDVNSGQKYDDKMTGVIESPVFVLSDPKVSMLVGGGLGSKTYVALCTLDGREEGKAKGKQGTETMQRIEWEVRHLVGKPVFLRVVDRATNTGGHITLDDFQADGRLDATPKQVPDDAAQGMVAYFPFDTGADELVGGRSGVLHGAAAIASDLQRGCVLDLDGNGSFALVPDFSKPTRGITGAAWVHAKSRPVWASIMKNWGGDKQKGLFHFGLREKTGNLDIQLGTTQGEVVVTDNVPLDTDAWQHVAFTADGATLRLYRDGKEVASTAYSDDLVKPTLTALAVGAKTDDSGTAADSLCPGFWNGMIDDVRLYDRALSASEIAALAVPGETPIAVLPPSPPGGVDGAKTDPPADKPPKPSPTGVIIHEMWTGIEGGKVSDLVNSGCLDTPPDEVRELTSFKAPGGIGDRYGVRIRGYIHPPTDGDYKFFIASDDEGQLYLSDDDHPDGKSRVNSGQSIALKAGERYYIEVLHKEAGGGDHVSVQWQRPDGKKEVIPGNCLSRFEGGELADVNFLTFDFEKGNLQGWKVVHGTFQQIVSNEGRGNRQGQYQLDTLSGGGEGQTGTVESPVFVIEGPKIHLRVGGGSGGQTVVKLVSPDEKELCTAHGPNRNHLDQKAWDVTEWVGQRAFLRVEDTHKGGNGFVLLDHVRIRGQIDRQATEDRFGEPLKVPDSMPVAAVESEDSEPEYEAFKTLGRTGGLAMLEGESTPAFHVLGKLALSEGETVDLELLGGKNAIRGPRHFEMRRAASYWTISLVSDLPASKPSKPRPVARIAAKDATIHFQWAQGLEPEEANCLLNCGLKISVGEHSHFLPLGPPQVVEPVPVNLDKVGRPLPPGRLPEHESLQLEVVRVEGLPGARCEPSNILKPGGDTAIRFPPWFFPDLWLHLTFDSKRSLVTVIANVESGPGVPAKPFRVRDTTRSMQALTVRQKRLIGLREQTTDRNRHKEIDKAMKPINNKLEQFAELNKLYAKLKAEPAKIHFRVYTVIDEQRRVIVMESHPPKELKKDTISGEALP